MQLVDRAIQALGDAYPITRESDHALVALPGSRSVLLCELRLREPALVVVGDLGAESIAPPRTLLEIAGMMGAGAIGIVGGRYVVRFAVQRDQIQLEALRDAIEYVARVSTELSAALVTSDPPRLNLFAHYYE